LLHPGQHGQGQTAVLDRLHTEHPWVYCKAMVPWRVVGMAGALLDDKGLGMIEIWNEFQLLVACP
jgi:hypothetical protein